MKRFLSLLGSVWLLACSSGETPLRVGDEGPNAGAAGRDSGAGGFGNAGSGGMPPVQGNEQLLEVDVQDGKGLVIEIVTLQCAGECADVVAVASGGHPPYSFEWADDGSTDPRRRVCPNDTTTFHVTATDTAVVVEELGRDAMSATAEVTARVLDCTDAGTPPEGELCFVNPSLEGEPVLNETGEAWSSERWDSCTGPGRVLNTASIWSAATTSPSQEVPSPAPADGETYVRLTACSAPGCFQPFLGEGTDLISQELCAPLLAGEPYSFELDIASPDAIGSSWGNVRAALALWIGSDSSCSQDQLVWSSPVAAPGWQTHCVTFTPTADASRLTFGVHEPNGLHFVYVDNLVPVAACP